MRSVYPPVALGKPLESHQSPTGQAFGPFQGPVSGFHRGRTPPTTERLSGNGRCKTPPGRDQTRVFATTGFRRAEARTGASCPIQAILDTIGSGTRKVDPGREERDVFVYTAEASKSGKGLLAVAVNERTGMIVHVISLVSG